MTLPRELHVKNEHVYTKPVEEVYTLLGDTVYELSLIHIYEILKKDEIKEVYVDKDGTTTTIWEASEEEQKAYLSEEHTEPLG